MLFPRSRNMTHCPGRKLANQTVLQKAVSCYFLKLRNAITQRFLRLTRKHQRQAVSENIQDDFSCRESEEYVIVLPSRSPLLSFYFHHSKPLKLSVHFLHISVWVPAAVQHMWTNLRTITRTRCINSDTSKNKYLNRIFQSSKKEKCALM